MLSLYVFSQKLIVLNTIKFILLVNMIGESRSEFRLKNPPEDGISSVKFGPSSSQFLLVSSWDCSVRLYDVQANSMRTKYTHDRPVLDVSFQVLIQL